MNELNQLREKISMLERNNLLFKETEKAGKIGGWQFDPFTLKQIWTDEVFRILEIDLEKGAPEVPKGLEFIDPGFRSMAEKAIQRAMEKGEPYNQEWSVTTARGNKKWMNAVCNPLMENGKLIRISGSFQDITNRINAENELRIREAILKRTEKIAHLGSWDWDIASDTVTWSDELFQIFRLNPENGAVSYADHPKIYTPESMQRLDKAVGYTLETGEPYEIDLEIIRGDGTSAFCNARGFAKKDEKGKVIRLFGSFQDITTRKNAEEQLNALNQQLQANEQQLKAANQQLQANEQQLKAANQELIASEQQLIASNQQLLANEQQLRAANQQLQASEQQLTAANQQLQANEQQLKAANQELIASEHQLKEANKKILTAKEEAEKNAERYLGLINNLDSGIVVHAADTSIIRTNQRASELLGLSEDQLKGKVAIDPQWKFIYEDQSEIPLVDYPVMRISTSKKPIKNQVLGVCQKSDDIVWLMVNGIPIIENNKEISEIIISFIDITQRKQTEVKLIEAKELAERNEIELKKAQEITHVGSFSIDLATNEVTWTEELYKIYGFDPILPPPLLDQSQTLFTPESWELLSSSIANAAKTGVPYEIELKTLLKEGSNGWMWARGEAIINSDGKITEIRGVVQDISERKNTEIELQQALQKAEEEEEKYRKLYDSNLMPISIFDDKTLEFLSVNKAFIEKYGYTKEEFLKMTILDIRPESEIDNLKQSVSLEDKGLENRGVFLHQKKNGEIIQVEIIRYDLVFEGKKAKLVFANDISKLKRSEIQLIKAKEIAEENQKLYEDLVQSSHNLIWKCDIKGNFTFLNSAWENTHGYKVEEMLGRPFSDFQRPEVFEHDVIEFTKHLEGGFVKGYETTHIIKDGTEIPLIFNALPLYDSTGEIIGTQGTAFDISKLKLTELDLIKAKEKAEEADRLKSAFLANMSHEIRTPMNGILGFTSLLQEPNLTGEEQQEFIEIIQKSGDRMLSTVNDIIDISRIESGLVELSVSEVNINELLKYLHAFFNPEAAKNGTQLTFKNDTSELDFSIKTDQEKINSILTNLIKNAIKFTNQGFIELGYELKKGNGSAEVEFYVKDTGVGIPKDRQTAIFERFIQADIEDKRAIQGSGLGLAISKAYAEMLGGKIWVESEPEQGSVFYFTVPYIVPLEKESEIVEIVSIERNADKFKKLNIVIAEDDVTSETLLEITINPFAHKILITRSGTETVEVCRNNPDIDLVLMDIQMPGINGYEATRQIREFNRDLIIIAQSAFALAGDSEKAIEAGCNAYISKPLKKAALVELINKFFK